MHRPLSDAIVGMFHAQPDKDQVAALASFPLSAWMQNYHWLDASGLALYLLDRLRCLRLQGAIPEAVLQRLEQNFADNRDRTADTFAEFVRINSALTAAGVTFVNLKGVSLVPDACEDPALRLQLDLDVLIGMRHVQACAVALGELGYALTGVSGQVWEFHAGSSSVPSVKDLYKAKPQRVVEVHFESGQQPVELAERREWAALDGFSFPVLAGVDRFVGQAMHVLKHLRGEWTRLSWLLEFRHSLLHRKDDRVFWRQVRARAGADREIATAIGAAIVVATLAFGSFAPEEITCWTVDTLDARMRLWLERYGREAIMADFPGTKLYLLQPELSPPSNVPQRSKRRKLIPLHRAPRVVHGAGSSGFRSRVRGWAAQTSFVAFRLRFHFVEGLRYALEAPRWRRIAATAPHSRPALLAADERGTV